MNGGHKAGLHPGTERGAAVGRATARLAAVVLATVLSHRVLAAGADPLPLITSYGSGVHAYFAGDYDRSYEDLSAAIEGGTTDPRVWYFRGLAALRLGRFDEAEADFTTAAEREARGTGGWPVARSLERVQGVDRLRLERHRVRARVAALQRDQDAVRRRYSEIEDAEPEVLRRRRPAPKPSSGGENPFADRPARDGAKDPATPEPIPEPTPSEPVSPVPDTKPEPEPKPEPPSDAKPEMTPEKPAVPADDPFGDNAPPKPSKPDDPFGDGSAPKPAKSDDPFGDGSAPKPDAPSDAAPTPEPAVPKDL